MSNVLRSGDIDYSKANNSVLSVFYPQTMMVCVSAAEAVMQELLMFQHYGVNADYSSYTDQAPDWVRYSTALSLFELSSSYDACAMVSVQHSWYPGELAALIGSCKDENAPVSSFVPEAAWGRGFKAISYMFPTLEQAQEKHPVGTHNMRFVNCEMPYAGLMAVPRGVMTKIYEKLYIDGPQWKQKLEELKDSGASERDIWMHYQLGISEFHSGANGVVYDLFRPMSIPMPGGNGYRHTKGDFAFGQRCLAAGITPKINTHQKIVTWGMHGYSMEDAQRDIETIRKVTPTISEEANGKAD